MTRFDPDIETAHVKPLVQRDPAASKARDRARLKRAILGRYGANPPDGAQRGTHVRTDGVKQVTRRRAIKKTRQIAHIEERWWQRYFRLFQEWMMDRTDIDEVGK